MKTLKIKKIKKNWHDITPMISYYDYIEDREYVVQMTEKEYFDYIR